MLDCPGVLAKLVSAFTGFSPAIMVARSCWNCSSAIAPDCLVPHEYDIGEGILVLALDFC